MNKHDFIAAVAAKGDMSKTEAAKAVDTMLDVIAKSLKKGDEVRLVGFGTFYVTKRAASEGRNPRTGAPIMIKASKLPKFKAGRPLKDEIN